MRALEMLREGQHKRMELNVISYNDTISACENAAQPKQAVSWCAKCSTSARS